MRGTRIACPLLNAPSSNGTVQIPAEDTRLSDHHCSLEHLVAQQTAELQKLHARLEQEIQERHRLEAVLRDNENRCRVIPDFTLSWEYWMAPDGTCLYSSTSCEQLTGYAPADFERDGNLLVAIVHPDDQALFADHIHTTQQPGKTAEIVVRIVTRIGNTRWIRQRCQPVFDGAGQWLGHRISTHDVTELVQAREEAHAFEELYHALFEKNQFVKLLIDPETGAIVDANQSACAFYGYAREVLRTLSVTDINVLPSEQVLAEMRQTTADQQTHARVRHRLASGEVRYVEVSSVPVALYSRTLLYSTIYDITECAKLTAALHEWSAAYTSQLETLNLSLYTEVVERTRTEKELACACENLRELNTSLRQSRDLLHTIFDNIQDGLVLIDSSGRVLAANYVIATLLGREVKELLHEEWIKLCQPDDAAGKCFPTPFPGHLVLQALRDGQPRRRRVWFLCPKGIARSLDMHILPVAAPEITPAHTAAVEHIVLHVVDMTDAIQLETLLIENGRLITNHKLMEMVGHEVNTPLQHILTLIERIPRLRKPERTAALSLAQDEIMRIGTLLHQLKLACRSSHDTYENVDINRLIERVLLLMSSHIARRSIVTDLELAPSLPPMTGRSDELIQMLLNIIINATEAMPDGGKLRLTTCVENRAPASRGTERGTRWADDVGSSAPDLSHSPFPLQQSLSIEISDTGRGMSPDVQKYIFELFFTTKGYGSGLGLFITRRIVTEHGGTISVQSEPGKGTTFIIRLPIDGGI